jgi:hypothetical protein
METTLQSPSSSVRKALRLDTVPRDNIATIAGCLDLPTLCAIHAVSRAIHDYTYKTHATWCFGVLKF